MTRGSHRVGRDPEVDEAFDALREALDELKQMEIEEFGVPEEEIEEKDNAALVQAEASAEETAALAAAENDISEALNEADKLAALQSEDHEKHATPKVWLASTILRRAYSNLHRSVSVRQLSRPPRRSFPRSKRSLKATRCRKCDQHSLICVHSM
jgi:multidrug efflux pump subunit AcrB